MGARRAKLKRTIPAAGRYPNTMKRMRRQKTEEATMAKSEVRQSKIQNQKSKIEILSKDDADRALQRIGQLERNIAGKEKDAEDEIDDIRSKLLDETAVERFTLEQNINALKAWAKGDSKSWAAKSLDLNFGTIGFRLPPPAIKFKLAVENILER